MPGISVPNTVHPIRTITISVEDERYLIQDVRGNFRAASNDEMQLFQVEALKVFKKLERKVNQLETFDFSQDHDLRAFANDCTEELAIWGQRAFREYFKDRDAGDKLLQVIANEEAVGTPAPTFWSSVIPFPWELLFPDDFDAMQYDKFPASLFWGLRYPIGRNLTEQGLYAQPKEQSGDSDMFFGLHHKLRHAHQDEWPRLQQLLAKNRGRIQMLSDKLGLTEVANERKLAIQLLKHLYSSHHNMLHFACHCRSDVGSDTLLLSVIEHGTDLSNLPNKNIPPIVKLNTLYLVDATGEFTYQPLVFLNACQTIGDVDEVRLELNFPGKFVQKRAAAVVATLCPVPDLFAAAFACQFYERFLNDGMEIGRALQESRLFFWERYHNPLGLAYGLYSSPFYRVPRQLGEGLI